MPLSRAAAVVAAAAAAAGAAIAVYLGRKAWRSAKARAEHEEKLRPLIEKFVASGETDIHIADEIRTLVMHSTNPHVQALTGVHVGFSSFMGQNIARMVMASPQGRTPEASYARFEQTNRLLYQYLHFPPDHPRAVEAIERTNYIHSRFPAIFEKYKDDMVYIWAQYAPFAHKRVAERIGARRRMKPVELQAIWLLSRVTLQKMGCDAPERWEDAEKFCYGFEDAKMVETKSSIMLSDLLLSFPKHVKPTGAPEGLFRILCEGILSPPMKRAAGLADPALSTRLGAWYFFNVVFPLTDLWYYHFAFSAARHTFPGEMGDDGLVARPIIAGREMRSVKEEDYGARFRIADVNDRYEVGAKLPMGLDGAQ
ncbi:hypothetical protein DFJ74DRAFT_682945 [Hyaloraphidium curvatum]|nr:hypothetical protein DFJ74DRAFT_682945 [Hyaloraphidium curvatum]